MICCWMIEEEGYRVKEALEAFKDARPDGIRHVRTDPVFFREADSVDFISTLHRRYPGL